MAVQSSQPSNDVNYLCKTKYYIRLNYHKQSNTTDTPSSDIQDMKIIMKSIMEVNEYNVKSANNTRCKMA